MNRKCDCGMKLVSLHFEDVDFGGFVEISERYCTDCSAVVE